MEIFGDTFMPTGLKEVRVRRCPRCVWPVLRPVGSLDQTHLLCESCGHCWHVEHGRLRPVNVLGCHGCAEHSKRDCIALLHDEFPHFSATLPDSVAV
jgi:hypothetical protein